MLNRTEETNLMQDLIDIGLVSRLRPGVHFGWGKELSSEPKLRENLYLNQEGLNILLDILSYQTEPVESDSFYYLAYATSEAMDNRDVNNLREVILPSYMANSIPSDTTLEISLRRETSEDGVLYMLCCEERSRGFGYSENLDQQQWTKSDKFLMSPRRVLQIQGILSQKFAAFGK